LCFPVVAIGCNLSDRPNYDYRNLYRTYSKYPDVELAQYTITEKYDPTRDAEHFSDSVRLCRRELGANWRAGKLTREEINPDETYPPTLDEFFAERRLRYWAQTVTSTPHYVVIALCDYKDHANTPDYAATIRVAWLVPAANLFDESKDAKALMAESVEDRHPFEFTPPQEVNGMSYSEKTDHWLIIERHMAATQPTTGQSPGN
jgi:hypothetical protein